MRRLLNAITSGGVEREGAWKVAAVLGLVGAVAATLPYVAQLPTLAINQRLTIRATDRLFSTVARFRGMAKIERASFHDRLVLAQQAAQQAPQAIVPFCQAAIMFAITTTSFAGIVYAIWPPMAALLLGTAVPTLAIRMRQARHGAALAAALAPVQRRIGFYRYLMTDVRVAKEMRVFGFGRHLHDHLLALVTRSANQTMALKRRQALTQSLLALGSGGVTAVGLIVVTRGIQASTFSIGDITLFAAAVTAVQGGVASVVVQMAEMRTSVRLFRNYLQVVDEPTDMPDGGVRSFRLSGNITLEGVWFRYDPTAPWVFSGLNLAIPVGKTVGLVGLNGAGKTTLLKLLCRLYDPQRGRVCWDGVDIREFDLAELRRMVTATFQDYGEYDLTAGENIGLGAIDPIARGETIESAARVSGIDGVIRALPSGYDTLLSRMFEEADSAASMLSGGQWQRVALARAFIRDSAELVVLDEPTSGLDALSEQRLCEALRLHFANRTLILVSHRISTLRFADLIVVLEKGRVAEAGTHAELVARGAQYAELWRAQTVVFPEPQCEDLPHGPQASQLTETAVS